MARVVSLFDSYNLVCANSPAPVGVVELVKLLAQILEIVYLETGILPENTKVIQK